jgi:hypothetical protein
MLGMSLSTFTFVHVAISLIAIATGLVAVYGLLSGKMLNGWTGVFLTTTVLTDVTGYGFPTDHLLPSQIIGAISLAILAVTIVALYGRHLAGAWSRIYAVGATLGLYLNVFVLVVQSFLKIPALNALAPTQSEPPFLIAQLIVLAIFLTIAVRLGIRFRGASFRTAPPVRS